VFLRDAAKPRIGICSSIPAGAWSPDRSRLSCTGRIERCRNSEAGDVTLVDQAGSLLNSPDESAEAAASTRAFEYTRKLEESYQRRIIERPGAHRRPGRVRATVTADLDFTLTERHARTTIRRKTAVPASKKHSTRNNSDGAEGFPAPSSNQPPARPAPRASRAAPTPGSAGQRIAGQRAGRAIQQRPRRLVRAARATRSGPHLVVHQAAHRKLEAPSVGVVFRHWQKVGADGKLTTCR